MAAQLNVVLWLARGWWIGAIGLAGWAVERLTDAHIRTSIMREPGSVERVRWLAELDDR